MDLLTDISRCNVAGSIAPAYCSASIRPSCTTIHPSVSVAFMIAPTVVDSPSASRQPRSVSGVMRRGEAAAASDPREIGAVGKISAIWQKVQPTWSAVCQLSRVTGKGGRLAVEPITTARHSLRHRGSCRDGRCLGISAGQR